MPRPDQRTLTNQPDPPDYAKSQPKRVRTQIHRRTKTTEPLVAQWDAALQRVPKGLRTKADKMLSRNPPKPSP
jgi:hypothetical protein